MPPNVICRPSAPSDETVNRRFGACVSRRTNRSLVGKTYIFLLYAYLTPLFYRKRIPKRFEIASAYAPLPVERGSTVNGQYASILTSLCIYFPGNKALALHRKYAHLNPSPTTSNARLESQTPEAPPTPKHAKRSRTSAQPKGFLIR